MPHDVNNNILAVGSEVVFRAKVTSIQASEDYCNITIESVHGRRPDAMKEKLCVNGGVLERVD